MTTQEFSTENEAVTAVLTFPLACGEHFGPAFTVGFYPGQPEIWIECEGGRQNIPVEHVNAVIKQLRRAVKIAAGMEKQP